MPRIASGHAARSSPLRDRVSLYDEVTVKIIAGLEAGRLLWVQPAATARYYSGINVLILWAAVIEHGFSAQNWPTFRQALPLGGHVLKGERGATVVYADRFIPKDERARAREAGEDPCNIPFLKRFTVFNAEQCDGLPDDIATASAKIDSDLILPQAEALIRATEADLRIGGNKAYYDVVGDFVRVPPPQAYFEPINWHRTVLHELGHRVGAPTRSARDFSGVYGSKTYAFEELIAEITAAFVCAELGIVPTVRHSDYIASCLEVLRKDNRAIVRAASAASKGADYL